MNELTESTRNGRINLSLKVHAVNKFLSPTDDELAGRRRGSIGGTQIGRIFHRMRVRSLLCLLSLSVVGVPAAAAAADCPGHPDALGTSRVLVVDPAEHARIGTMQYRETLPLQDHEVVLTFDDGPLPPYSNRVLETLASQCVKATYFLIGRMSRAYPEMVRKIHEAGHSVGTHTMSHPYTFNRMTPAKAHQEMDDGIAAAADALGNPGEVAPFFRIPGLIRANVVESYMAQKGIMIWSADFPADDWKHLSANEVMKRALTRLEQHRKGVLLLHDIQPATALMLPKLLAELKRRGYRVVHVVPATPDLPKTATTPDQWLMREPAVASIPLPPIPPRPRVTAPASTGVVPPTTTKLPGAPQTAPATPAANTPPGPRAEITDVTGAIKTDARPVTTSNMPKAGIP
jgi:peptidoglycan/xylan/chitin deacetylase (PgdA/CDA1 family)